MMRTMPRTFVFPTPVSRQWDHNLITYPSEEEAIKDTFARFPHAARSRVVAGTLPVLSHRPQDSAKSDGDWLASPG
jgi:hypothetical protein